jgi:hypothetical protein
MFSCDNRHIKLIDFGFAATVENNEITKELPIEGTIAFGNLKFLKFCSEIPFDLSLNLHYEYERTFDLYCALNVIIIMTDKHIKKQFYGIKQKPLSTTDQNIILDMYSFWLNLKEINEDYSELLELIDNLKESKDFDIIRNHIKNLPICKD